MSELSENSGLTQLYLNDERAFWRNVQEPASRVKDNQLMADLAALALARFDSAYVQASATVVLCYRAAERDSVPPIAEDKLLSKVTALVRQLDVNRGFTDGRWFLSLCLAECALCLSQNDKARAMCALRRAEPLLEVAYSHGQLFTNIVKTTLLRCVVGSVEAAPTRDEEIQLATRVLAKSGVLPQHYKFANEFAYEEVAYVYTMLRQVFNWTALVSGKEPPRDLTELESRGFAWRCVGGPFSRLAGR